LRTRQKLGKYRIDGRIENGGFATVYEATDTLEGVRVALKIPYDDILTEEVLRDMLKEVRLAARLKHPHILPLKNADYIDGRLVLAYPLGERSLAQRLQSRVSLPVALDLAEQMIAAAAHAHEHRIIHCDIKPQNMILFDGGHLMLTDFGIAKIAHRTIVRASGSGTVGFCAPEQAMGKPSFASDVFSLGLVVYRMFSGRLPEWPFAWPPPGHAALRAKVHADLLAMLRRAIEIDPRKRYPHAGAMLAALLRCKSKAIKSAGRGNNGSPRGAKRRDWRTVQRQQFQEQFGKALETHFACSQCEGPMSEAMHACPWCGADHSVHYGETDFAQQCPRCQRGLKLDWQFCPWCYGAGFELSTTRQYADSRYVSLQTARCSNAGCTRKQLMPFMCYCPWCRRKVRRKWKIEGSKGKCSCGWGVVAGFWNYCAWCSKKLTE
jgi:serine/threonine-protein kinase